MNPRLPLRRILCPVDLTAASATAFESALSLAARSHAELLAVHVGDTLLLYEAVVARTEPVAVAHPTHAERLTLLSRFAQELISTPAQVTNVVAEGPIAPAIVECADRHAVDLIVMGTHGRRGLNRLVHGSVVGDVIASAHQPVLVFPPSRPRAGHARHGRFRCLIADAGLEDVARGFAEQFWHSVDLAIQHSPGGTLPATLDNRRADGPDLIVLQAGDANVRRALQLQVAPVLVLPVPRSTSLAA